MRMFVLPAKECLYFRIIKHLCQIRGKPQSKLAERNLKKLAMNSLIGFPISSITIQDGPVTRGESPKELQNMLGASLFRKMVHLQKKYFPKLLTYYSTIPC